MRLLIVEDDATIADFVAKGLTEAGFAVDVAADGARGLELATDGAYDVAIVDVMLPHLDGLTLIDRMRARGVRTPVLILSARRTVDDRVRGLQAGGDDYLTKPFAFAELLARVQALIRRSTGTTEPTRLTVGDLTTRSADPSHRTRRPLARSAAARVRAARVSDAQPRPGALKDDDPLACLGLQLQPGDQRGRRARLTVEGEDRQGLRAQAPPHSARSGHTCSNPVARDTPTLNA